MPPTALISDIHANYTALKTVMADIDQREIKRIVCGLRHTLILKRYPTVARLRAHLDRFEWDR